MKKVLLLACSLCLSSITIAQTLQTIPVINIEIAEKIAKTALENCKKHKFTPSVSVVDNQGTLLFFMRGKDSGPHSVKTSFRKAYTAATLKIPSSTLSGIVDLPKLSQLAKMGDDILLLAGGFPVTYQGKVIGAAGMSGAPSPEVEEQCVKDAVEEIFK